MGQCRGKRGQKSKHSTCNTKQTVASSVPSTRGIGYNPKTKSPNSMQIAVTSMAFSQVAVSQYCYGASLKSNQKCIVHSHDCSCCKKDKAIHNHFRHIDDTSIPNLFTRYTMEFMNSKIVVVERSTNQEDDLDEPLEKLPLPWIALSVRNGNLFGPTINNVIPSLGLNYNTNYGVT